MVWLRKTLGEDMKESKNHPHTAPHRLAELWFRTDDGRRKGLRQLPFYRPIYNSTVDRLLLRTSRQSIKSTFLRDQLYIRSLMRSGNAALYVAPTGNQISDFSKTKFDQTLLYNRDLKSLSRDPAGQWNVHFKGFRSGSRVTLRSVGGHQGAERVRGIVANHIYKDEIQSFEEEHIPVIDSCATTFDGRDGRPMAFYCDAGTPLSPNNPIEQAWQRSRGYEWIIRCPHCKRYQEPLGMQHIDPQKPYLFCQWCGDNMRKVSWTAEEVMPEGQWVATYAEGRFNAYRVVRLMMPWARWLTPNADGILDQLETWTERRFYNETMALPFAGSAQPTTEEELRACCTAEETAYRLPQTEDEIARLARTHSSYPLFAGLDWALNSTETTPSFTIFAIFALINNKLKLIFAHRFTGLGSGDPDFVLESIGKWMTQFDVTVLGADYGVGFLENQRLRENFPGRVITFHYKGSTDGSITTTYDPNGPKFMLPRTPSLEETFKLIKLRGFIFPVWADVQPYVSDLLHVHTEYNDVRRTVKYRRSGRDDFLHVMNYAHMAKRMYTNGEIGYQELVQYDDAYTEDLYEQGMHDW